MKKVNNEDISFKTIFNKCFFEKLDYFIKVFNCNNEDQLSIYNFVKLNKSPYRTVTVELVDLRRRIGWGPHTMLVRIDWGPQTMSARIDWGPQAVPPVIGLLLP